MPKQNGPDGVSAAPRRAAGFLYRQSRLVVTLTLMLCMGLGGTAAAVSSSDNYKVTETQFGSGGSARVCSGNLYCAKTSVGDTAAGSTSSTSYGAQAGSNTTEEPLLEVTASGGQQDLGTLDVGATGTATFTVGVRSYLSNGYVMQVMGSPPSQGTHTLTALTTPTTSHAGAEQFGINLVANNSPAIGADPLQDPSGDISFGVVADDYITPDLFKYVEGDVVAQSETSTGKTLYTVSMILNISNTTPAGRYDGSMAAVVVPLY